MGRIATRCKRGVDAADGGGRDAMRAGRGRRIVTRCERGVDRGSKEAEVRESATNIGRR